MSLFTEEQKAKLIQEERERRRLIRLKQVRQQSEQNARRIRETIREKQNEEIQRTEKEIKSGVEKILRDYKIGKHPLTPRLIHKNSTPKVTPKEIKRKTPRGRAPMTAEAQEKALIRNRMALARLRHNEENTKREREERIQRRSEAARIANRYCKGGEKA